MLSFLSTRQKQVLSVLVTFLIYSLLVNWKVGLLLVIGVGFHELSHLAAARLLGLKTKGFYLMPFVGGVALVDDEYPSLSDQAIVVIAGPLGGALLAFATAGVYWATGIVFFGQAAEWMLYLNLFNLLPLSFLDGGQLMDTITNSISRTLALACSAVSTVVAVIVIWNLNSVLAVLIAIMGSAMVMNEYRNWKNYRAGNHYLCSHSYLNPPLKLSGHGIFTVIVAWSTLATAMIWIHRELITDPSVDFIKLFSN